MNICQHTEGLEYAILIQTLFYMSSLKVSLFILRKFTVLKNSLSWLKYNFRAYLGSPIQDMHWTNQGEKRLVSSIQVQSCFALNLQTSGVALSYFSFLNAYPDKKVKRKKLKVYVWLIKLGLKKDTAFKNKDQAGRRLHFSIRRNFNLKILIFNNNPYFQ